MSGFQFPDNTVLCNFACVDRLDLLEAVLNGRGRWTSAVAYEASQSAKQLVPLYGLHDAGWLGAPIEITDEQHIWRIQQIRRGSSVAGRTSRSNISAKPRPASC